MGDVWGSGLSWVVLWKHRKSGKCILGCVQQNTGICCNKIEETRVMLCAQVLQYQLVYYLHVFTAACIQCKHSAVAVDKPRACWCHISFIVKISINIVCMIIVCEQLELKCERNLEVYTPVLLYMNLVIPKQSFGSRCIKYAGWVIEYAIFLHGLAQQWRLQKKQNLEQR